LSSRDAAARPPQLRALTGLRFFAALQVIVFHCSRWRQWPAWAPLRNAAGAGYVAVSLFFVLSGFILTYAHAGPEAPPIDRRAFYVNRFARIYPAYAFALLLAAPMFAVHTFRVEGPAAVLEQGTAVALLLQAHVPAFAMAWNPPAWSLSAEAFFYLLFPLVAPRLARCRVSTALGVGAACYGAALALPLAYLYFAPDAPVPASSESQAFWLNELRYGPLVRFPEFVLGIVAGRLYLDMGAPRDSARWTWPAAASLAVLFVALGCSPAIPYVVLHNGVLAPVFALLVTSLAAGGGAIARVLASRPLVALGDASYSLYVLHLPLFVPFAHGVSRLLGPSFYATPFFTLTFVAFAVGAALLCHRYVERPGGAFTVAWLRRPRPDPR
jgi:peptidoglycan/LPS O-acetylase OafA/YrhL